MPHLNNTVPSRERVVVIGSHPQIAYKTDQASTVFRTNFTRALNAVIPDAVNGKPFPLLTNIQVAALHMFFGGAQSAFTKIVYIGADARAAIEQAVEGTNSAGAELVSHEDILAKAPQSRRSTTIVSA